MSSPTSGNKPKSVQWAVVCLWVSVGLVSVLTVDSWVGLVGIPRGIASTVTNLLTLALLALVAIKLGAGRGWARWLFAVVYVLGSLMFVVSLLLAPQVFRSLPTVLQGSGIVQFALQTAALVLMFTEASRQWFKAKRIGK